MINQENSTATSQKTQFLPIFRAQCVWTSRPEDDIFQHIRRRDRGWRTRTQTSQLGDDKYSSKQCHADFSLFSEIKMLISKKYSWNWLFVYFHKLSCRLNSTLTRISRSGRKLPCLEISKFQPVFCLAAD